MTFIVGTCYTRDDIHKALGGETEHYLPQSGGRIVAGCFDPRKNPDAPQEVQVGHGPRRERKARLLAEQEIRRIPVFLKRGSNEWQYQGEYEFVGLSISSEEIEAAEAKSGRHGEIVCLLRLRPTTDSR